MFHEIKSLVADGHNVLMSEIDTIFLQDFSEIFNLDKLTLFARCNGSCKSNPSLSKGYYLNSGLVYYPSTLRADVFINQLPEDGSVASSGINYEECVNRMFYSQFENMDSGISYLEKIGFSKYNWRGALSLDNDQMPEDPSEIKHVHFLNMSEYIHGDSNFASFWYNQFLDRFHSCVINGESVTNVLIDLLQYYADGVRMRSEQKSSIQQYIVKLKENGK